MAISAAIGLGLVLSVPGLRLAGAPIWLSAPVFAIALGPGFLLASIFLGLLEIVGGSPSMGDDGPGIFAGTVGIFSILFWSATVFAFMSVSKRRRRRLANL